ncbi:hypothetical protein FI667_g815, partial [Globisporangium splendens]
MPDAAAAGSAAVRAGIASRRARVSAARELRERRIVPEQAEWIAVESKNGAGLPDVHYKDPQTSFVYAAHRGLLSLLELHNDAKRDRASALSFSLKDVPFETLYVPSSSACFDLKWVGGNNPLWKWFLEHVLGYDTILMNQLAKQYGARGFFYRESFKVIADMNYGVFNPDDAAKSWLLFVALKFKVLHTIVFLFFILTALVAFVLTETQKRMLTFTELFQNRSQLQLPVANLVLAYFAQSLMFVPILVGMLFFLFELYKDQLLAFAVLSMMWMGESFSVISVRSRLSQAYFPPLFFGLFAIFHLYFFAFPFGFSYVVFAAMAMLLGLLTLFFWNNFEIPALNHGQISLRRPREEGFGVSG